jgi:hypothetical protein
MSLQNASILTHITRSVPPDNSDIHRAWPFLIATLFDIIPTYATLHA